MNLPSAHVCCCCCNNECCSSSRMNPIHRNNSANFCPNNDTLTVQEGEIYVAHLSPKRKRRLSFLASFKQTLGTNRHCVHVVCIFSVILLSFVNLGYSTEIQINNSNFLNGESTPASPFGNIADSPSIPTGSSSSLNSVVAPGPSSSPAVVVNSQQPPSTQSYFINGYANQIQKTNVSDLRALIRNKAFQLEFRTVCPFGNIINDDKFALRLHEAGYLTHLNLPNEVQTVQSSNIVADGQWHSLTFRGSSILLDDPDSNNRYGLKVDWDMNMDNEADNRKLYFFDGFVGCIRFQLPANNSINPNSLDAPQSSPTPTDQNYSMLFDKRLQKYQPCNDLQFDLSNSAQCFQAKYFLLCSQCKSNAECVFTDGKNECECPEPEDETVQYEPPLCNRILTNRSFSELIPESRESHSVLSDDDTFASSTTGSSRSSFPPQLSPLLSSTTEHMEASASIEQSRIQPEGANCSCVRGVSVQTESGCRCDCTGTGFVGRRCNNDVCDDQPPNICGQYGKCFDDPDIPSGFECYCKPGFAGEHCEINYDECLSNPCVNGTCEDGINTYRCACHPGYYGKICDAEIDECESNPCKQGGTCRDRVADYDCECVLGYTGKNCEINIDDCESVPCKNGGICHDGINAYTCDCSDTGFSGLNCEHNIDDCEDFPCQNGGNCSDGIKTYNCSCYSAYMGHDCENDIADCDPNPCNDHGTCYEKSVPENYQPGHVLSEYEFSPETAAGFKCVCHPGYEGETCETDIDECQENPFPCRGHGTCINEINNYRCECDKGFEGEHCETDINECDPNPCKFAKECKNLAGDYQCDCMDEYGGKNCTVALTACLKFQCHNEGLCIPHYNEATDAHTYVCHCKPGFAGDKCNVKTTLAFSGSSLVEIVKNDDAFANNKYTLNLNFQTTLPDVILAVGEGGTYFSLGLLGGKLNLQTSLLNNLAGMSSGKDLHNGDWHRVGVSINDSHAILSADSEQVTLPLTDSEDQPPTGFHLTILGRIKSSFGFLNKLELNPFVGCMQDVKINGDLILPQPAENVNLTNILSTCERKNQCNPNPCQNEGTCTDLWNKYTCNCIRPHLGDRCQYSYNAATFNQEDTPNSLSTVDIAPGRFGRLFDISMFVRTREQRGTIFLLCNKERGLNGSYIEATITKSGNLVVQAKWAVATDAGDETSIKSEPYTVDGVLSNGEPRLISVQRDKSFVVIKVDGLEHFRKSHNSNRGFSPTVMYIGGRPAHLTGQEAPTTVPAQEGHSGETSTSFPDGSVDNNTEGTATDTDGNIEVQVPDQYRFKGTIQDVRVNLSSPDPSPTVGHTSHLKPQSIVYIVEFFNLTEIHPTNPALGRVVTQNLLNGTVSDDHCKISPCKRGTCSVTWNDFKCECDEGFDGRTCDVRLRCVDVTCPTKSACVNIGQTGFECNAEAAFDGKGHTTPHYNLKSISPMSLNVTQLSFRYRSKQTGNVIHMSNGTSFLRVSLDTYGNESAVYFHFINNVKLHFANSSILDGDWHSISFRFARHENSAEYPATLYYDKLETKFNEFEYHSHYLRDLVLSPSVQIVVGSSLSIDDDGRPISSDSDHTHSQYYRGCLRDVYIGEYRLPFISQSKLEETNADLANKSLIETTAPTAFYIDEKYHYSEQLPRLGCILCYEKDCKNGGECADPNTSYDCSCAPGFEGATCNTNIDECVGSMCQHDSTCVDGNNNYTCTCAKGYDGWLCNNDIDECEGEEKCNGQGECVNLIGEFRCECSEEYTGNHCEKRRKSNCLDEPCENGATCNDVEIQPNGVSFKCHCATGYEGEFCSDRINYCKDISCGNGSCTNSLYGYKCDCESGFDGINCDVNIDECKSSPCKNKGKCIDGINSFTCNCNDTGFTGTICEVDVDECQMDPWHTLQQICQEPLICENFIGSYQCSCQNKLMCGSSCDVRNPCYNSPENVTCQNGGTCKAKCEDRDNPTYECVCQPGFQGELCEQQAHLQRPADESGIDILLIIIPVLAAILIAATVGIIILVRMARRKRATRGVYSPSQQEYCNPRVELDNVMKPPPEERLI